MATRHASVNAVNYVDGHALYLAQQHFGAKRHEFDKLKDRLAAIRVAEDLAPAQVSLAFVPIEPRNEKQSAFVSSIERMGFAVEAIPFWWTWTDAPAATESTGGQRDRQSSLAPAIAYSLGVLIGRAGGDDDTDDTNGPDACLVTGDFGVFRAAMDFVERGGELTIAFYRSLLDPRWANEGLLDDALDISFVDLESYASELLGVTLSTRSYAKEFKSSGLSSI